MRAITGFVAVILAACSGSSDQPAEIQFAFSSEAAGGVEVHNIQFYVHDVALLDSQGRWQAFGLAAVPPWQSEKVALIDLAGDAATHRNTVLHGWVESSDRAFAGIRFTVGVPFELNHGNPLTAPAPLDRSELFWAWQSGHKFLRVDLADAGHEWSFHLGSTGCSSASALRPPAAPCLQPNRMRVEITGIDPIHEPVQLQLDELVSAMRAANHAICTGDYAHNPACVDAYAKTGLQLESGACPEGGCANQRLWARNAGAKHAQLQEP
jgi:uncharacterized repeat protein (TIGR04052 family)